MLNLGDGVIFVFFDEVVSWLLKNVYFIDFFLFKKLGFFLGSFRFIYGDLKFGVCVLVLLRFDKYE